MNKRRRKGSAVARLRPFWMPIAFCALVLVAGLAVAATWPGFDVKKVVVSGNYRVSRDDVVARARIRPHVSIWLQNTGAIARRVESIPYVAIARVGRLPPSTIRIAVSERTPFAVVRSGSNAVLVDRSLRVLEPTADDDPLHPTFIVEPGLTLAAGEFIRDRAATALRDAFEAIQSRHIDTEALRYDRFGGLVVTMRGGLQLMLGSQTDFSGKLTLATAILSQVVGRQRRVAAIDLRAPSAPVLVYR